MKQQRREVFVFADRCMGCHSCELACATAHTAAGNLYGAILGGETEYGRIFIDLTPTGSRVPVHCHHCANAPCVAACPMDAMRQREDRTSYLDEENCIGCWSCVAECPFGYLQNSDFLPIKCDRNCLDDEGVPACVRACPTHALVYMTTAEYSAARRRPRAKAAAR